MSTAALNNHHRIAVLGTLVTSVLAGAGCVAEDTTASIDEALVSTSSQPPVTPAMQYLAHLPADSGGEKALGKLFAQGTVSHVPVGDGTGYPVLFNSVPELNWLASQLWGGKTFRVESAETHPNGDPIVRLDNKIIKTPVGGLLNLFDAYVTRGTLAETPVGQNSKGEVVPQPQGTLPLIGISFLSEPVVVDDKPSIWLNYFQDRTLPVIRRILDEIREVDATNCPGLYLGRALARRCTSLSCGELGSPLVDFPEHLTFETKYEWTFWTYFLLNFGQPAGTTCDLSSVISKVETELSIDLPAVPAAQ
jgi:hypothetical protein